MKQLENQIFNSFQSYLALDFKNLIPVPLLMTP